MRSLGFFGSGAACQFTPSIVFSNAVAAAGVALSSPSQVVQASQIRNIEPPPHKGEAARLAVLRVDRPSLGFRPAGRDSGGAPAVPQATEGTTSGATPTATTKSHVVFTFERLE